MSESRVQEASEYRKRLTAGSDLVYIWERRAVDGYERSHICGKCAYERTYSGEVHGYSFPPMRGKSQTCDYCGKEGTVAWEGEN